MNEPLLASERPPPVSRPPTDDGSGAPPGTGAAGLAPLAEPTVAPVGWPRRAVDAVSAYLPLLLMALLALGSWWLVKNTPLFERGRVGAPLRHEPDYTMTGFRVQRFAADGALRVQLEGDLMRHYPDTETIEIDNPRIREIADDGRVTLATAREALSNKDASEVQLSGDAHIVRVATATELAIDFRSEFLHYVQASEQVRTHLPVVITQGGTEIHADAMTYDNIERIADFSGRIHAVLQSRPTPSQAPSAQRRPRQAASSATPRAPVNAPNRPLVFITGASSGIGQALGQRYQRAGYRLALVARRSEAITGWLLAQGWAEAEGHAVYRADVANVDSIVAAARRCMAEQGLPDVVVANAGISVGMDSAMFEDLAVMERVLATNTLGLAATFHPFIAAMRARGSGTLVGIASVAGVRGLPGHGAYCASKAAAIAYCESLRGELRRSGVTVVTISPGYIDTPLTRRNRYRMPFKMPADAFAERAFDAIGAGARHRVIPWQMAVVARAMRLLPGALFDRLAAGRPRKARGSAAGE